MSRGGVAAVEPGGGRRALALVSAAMGVSFVAQTMLALAVPIVALEYGASVAVVGLLVSLPFWIPTLLAIPIGRLVSRFGARRVMLVGSVGMTLAPWWTVVIGGMVGLVGTQLLIGVTQISMGISAQATVATVGQRERSLERAFGWYTTSVSTGQLLGPILAGVLLERLAARGVFAIVGLVPLVCVLAAALLRMPAVEPSEPRRSIWGYGDQLDLLRSNAGVQMALLMTVAMLFAFASHAAFLPVYLSALAVPATVIGAMMSVRALCSTLVRPLMPWVVARLRSRSRAAVSCTIAVALALGLTGSTQHLLALATLAAVLGLAVGLAQPLAMVALADHVGAADRPAALGFRLTVNQAAQLAGPLALGGVAQLAGLGPMFIVGGLVVGLAAGGIQRLRPAFDAREAERVANDRVAKPRPRPSRS